VTLLFFLTLLGFLLLGVVDVRRGLLLTEYRLVNPWINLHRHHFWWLTLGAAGLVITYYRLHGFEARREVDEKRLQSLARVTLFLLFGLLVVDTLLLYRGVAAARIIEVGKMEIGSFGLSSGLLPGSAELVPLASTPFLLRPVAIMVNYLGLVWHATLLALLWAGLGVVALPLYFGHLISPKGAGLFRSLMGGVVYAIPQPFCSCCAAPIAATLYRTGASLVSSVAFLLSSPTLNITAVVLAATILPWPYALLRTLGGGLLIVLAAYLVATLAGRLPLKEASEPPRGIVGFVSRVFNRYCTLFQFEPVDMVAMTPAGLIRRWGWSTWRMAQVVVPTLAVGGVVAGVIVTFVPDAFGNDFLGILLAASLGTILMISTWTEIPVAAILAAQGLTGPAAALLVTLPVISLPCLVIFGGALGSGRVSLLLGLITFAAGVVAGLVFM
jgi:uncharacterized membrane protein YraQ (UPF0718 family)